MELTADERFFYEHAGFSYDPKTESMEDGKARCAIDLAVAERDARTNGWYFEWSEDDGCAGCECGDKSCGCFRPKGRVASYHQPFYCAVYDEPGGKLLANLGGICGADGNYRRVIEAELALEALAEVTA